MGTGMKKPTCRHFFSSLRALFPDGARAGGLIVILLFESRDCNRRLSDLFARLSCWMLRRGKLNLFILLATPLLLKTLMRTSPGFPPIPRHNYKTSKQQT